ncbi:high mobility group box domain-containing protein [Gongronella butleri]|nr:high mobility group box domain-containing protein [Gongronella butleri]
MLAPSSWLFQQARQVSTKVLHPKKFTSILADVPPRPRSGWQVFLRQKIADGKSEGTIDAAKATRVYAQQWKTLSDADKQVYQRQFEQEKEKHLSALNAALERATPKQIHDENILRRRYNVKVLRDPRQPKRPMNAYMLYLAHLRDNGPADFRALPTAQQTRQGAKMFKELPQHEKQPYDDKAKKLAQEYRSAMARFKAQL